MLDRRTFIGGVVGGILAAPLAADAQQGGKVYRDRLSEHPHPGVRGERGAAFLRALQSSRRLRSTAMLAAKFAIGDIHAACPQRNPDATQDSEAICPY